MEKLTAYEIEDIRQKVLVNAIEMLSESKVLFDHKYYARSYTLAHLACEEFAKLAILYRVGLDSMRGFFVDWGTLSKRLSDHRTKLRVLAFIDRTIALLYTTEQPSAAEAIKRLGMVEQWNEYKNLSLYVSLRDGKFVSPLEVIGYDEADQMLKLAELRAAFFCKTELATHTNLDSLADNPQEFKLFDQFLENSVDPSFGRSKDRSKDPLNGQKKSKKV